MRAEFVAFILKNREVIRLHQTKLDHIYQNTKKGDKFCQPRIKYYSVKA